MMKMIQYQRSRTSCRNFESLPNWRFRPFRLFKDSRILSTLFGGLENIR
jgi:hypothetical protein